MPRAFASIAFTPGVKAAQTQYGSREANIGVDFEPDPRNTLTEHEARFIAERDSFYQATVSETGWPYVQHRGGPIGFLKVLDARTIGYADLSGNAQYVSVGNLHADDRISLILMDYVNKRRLKLLGRARIVHDKDDPALMARLEVPTYRARVERGVLIHIEACEWNCPQHITPRWTQAQVEDIVAPLREELHRLRALPRDVTPSPAPLGDGPLPLRISGMRQLTPRVRAYELRHAEGLPLPAVAAGAHLPVPVTLADGSLAWRHYSVVSLPAGGQAYEIAVLRDDAGRGGSVAAHAQYQLGRVLNAQAPRNAFALHDGDPAAVLLAGGIGITPIRAMAHALRARGTPFTLHHAARSTAEAAYAEELRAELGAAYTLYTDDQGQRLPLASLLRDAPAQALFYACGPAGLLDALSQTAQTLGIAPQRLRFERFQAEAPQVRPQAQAIEVVLHRSGQTLHVAADQTVLAAVQSAGVAVRSSCLTGNCGICAVRVLEGEPEHRDHVLTDTERGPEHQMCICVSRAHSPRLVLDL